MMLHESKQYTYIHYNDQKFVDVNKLYNARGFDRNQ